MNSRRVVLVFHEPPAPFGTNAASRWYYVLLKGLVERGHRVTAFAVWSRPGDQERARRAFPEDAFDLRLYPSAAPRGLASKFTTLLRPCSYSFGPDLLRDLREELDRGFDVLHLESLWTGWVGLDYRRRAVLNTLSLYSIDQSMDRPARWMDRLRRWSVWRGERWLVRQYGVHIAL